MNPEMTQIFDDIERLMKSAAGKMSDSDRWQFVGRMLSVTGEIRLTIGDQAVLPEPEPISEERRDAAMFEAAKLARIARDLDQGALENCLATNPGPQFYIDMLSITVAFVRGVRRVFAQRGHERLKVPFVMPGSNNPN